MMMMMMMMMISIQYPVPSNQFKQVKQGTVRCEYKKGKGQGERKEKKSSER
jgi:hypothetical protein